ncbi:hypothetical protein ACFO5R_08190 [Halosolutus amylolyticus]|uniref:Small CPxCG-related zinc finger protein n=1 Tax=Halosolutus amylolyticus TaxID=2932267 RepID=A0ABD5PPB1_9EURY|nr:hypothetical protein [Halosolutus amylolyticus]
MNADCEHCGWHGSANELNWMLVDDDAVGAKRVCPACRTDSIVILA